MNPVYIDLVARILLVVGGLTWLGIATFNTNLVQMVFRRFEVPVYVLVGLSAIYVSLRASFFLPFLGPVAIPSGIVNVPKTPTGADSTVEVDAPPNRIVIYWAAEPSQEPYKSPRQAYGNYENAGIAISNALGKAILKVRSPAPYYVFRGKMIKPHVHYRVADSAGMFGKVKTAHLIP